MSGKYLSTTIFLAPHLDTLDGPTLGCFCLLMLALEVPANPQQRRHRRAPSAGRLREALAGPIVGFPYISYAHEVDPF